MTLTKPDDAHRGSTATMCPACAYTSWETHDDAVGNIWEHVRDEHPSTVRRLRTAAVAEIGRERRSARRRLTGGPTQTKRTVGKIPAVR